MRKAEKTQRWQFSLTPCGFGAYNATYTSPESGRSWTAIVTDMTIIDAVNCEEPKRKDLDYLKQYIKHNYKNKKQ